MKFCQLLNAFCVLATCPTMFAFVAPVSAITIASTSFENEDALAGAYINTGDKTMDHDLVNNDGEPVVDSTASSTMAGDLGFDARYENTRDSNGLTGGARVGVTDSTTTVAAFPDGTQGYLLSHVRGKMILEFDPVIIDGHAPVLFSIDYFVQETGWESSDEIQVFLTIDGATTVDIVNSSLVDIDSLDIEDEWIRGEADLTGLGTSAVLTVALDSDSSAESLYIDRVTFTGDPVPTPEPGALLLALLGTCVSSLIRTRAR
jgi:hypothetical protein